MMNSSFVRSVVRIKRRPSFSPKSFLAKVGEGRSIGKYRKGQFVFSQGDPADEVFYLQRGKVKITVVSVIHTRVPLRVPSSSSTYCLLAVARPLWTSSIKTSAGMS